MSFLLLRRFAAPAVVLAALVVGLASAASASEAQSGEAEVRIAARLLDDGRVDFALQQRDGGSWGQRLRPEQHYFPAGAAIGEWLDSSAVAVDSAGRVRISARLGDDGRVEFTLQQQLGEGSWGERLRAQRRFFPAGAAEGVWLVTTPLAVSTPVPAAGGTVETEADGQRAPVACLAVREAGAPIATSSEGSPFEHRSMSGEGNNADHPAWGMAGTALLRLAPNSYVDGVSTPAGCGPTPAP